MSSQVRARLPVSAVAQLGLDAVEQLVRAERKVRSNKRRQEILAEQRRVEREEAERQAAIRAEAERLEFERLKAEKKAAEELEEQARMAQKALEKKEKARRYREEKKRQKEQERRDEQAERTRQEEQQAERNGQGVAGVRHEVARLGCPCYEGPGGKCGAGLPVGLALRIIRADRRARLCGGMQPIGPHLDEAASSTIDA